MSSYSKVILIGNLTKTPEVKTVNGNPVTDFSIAINDSFSDKEEETTFVDVTLWGKSAENLCKYKKVGDSILVEGRLKMDRWSDKSDGKPRTKLKVVSNNVTFISSKTSKDTGEGEVVASTNKTPVSQTVRAGTKTGIDPFE